MDGTAASIGPLHPEREARMPKKKDKPSKKSTRNTDAETVVSPAADGAPATDDAKSTRRAEKAERKAVEKAAKKAAKDAAKDEAKKVAKKDASTGEPTFKHVRKKKLASGKGPSPREIGESLVALFNAGKSDEAESTWYHRKIESIEDDGSVFEGWKGVLEKGKWWKENFTVLSMRASGPYVCATGFSVVYTGRVRLPDGMEVDAHECGVYTVEKGRIVREQFMKAAF